MITHVYKENVNDEISSAISLNDIRCIIESCLNLEPIALFGIKGTDLPASMQWVRTEEGNLELLHGIYVTEVQSSSPAFQLGLKVGEIIVAMNGKEISGITQFKELLLNYDVGKEKAEFVQAAFMGQSLRIYTSPDPVGAELGGALKNVIALCAGVTDGLGFGDNTKAMLMTRGLTEIARLGVALGAQKDTLAGLAGVGDLIVTCTSMHSRNRRAGILIGQGKSVADAMQEVGAVVEGYYATKSAWELGQKMGVDMPIVEAAYRVLYENEPARTAVQELLTRPGREEQEDAGWL